MLQKQSYVHLKEDGKESVLQVVMQSNPQNYFNDNKSPSCKGYIQCA